MSTSILVSGPNSNRRYTSIRSAARALSGNGTDRTERTRSRLRRLLNNGGGYVGRSYVSYSY